MSGINCRVSMDAFSKQGVDKCQTTDTNLLNVTLNTLQGWEHRLPCGHCFGLVSSIIQICHFLTNFKTNAIPPKYVKPFHFETISGSTLS